MKINFQYAVFLIFACFSSLNSSAQFSISAQLRTRAEFRNGQGAPLPAGVHAAGFISQRSRISTSFSSPRIKTAFSFQDVRVWGQDVSTINRNTVQEINGLMLHEAWADIILSDTAIKHSSVSMKIGRQELIYDDQRLIGNLDWLQQGRRHDAAVLKIETRAWKLHAGAAFNQNRESQSGTIYSSTPPGAYPSTTNGGVMYKSMQYLYAGRKLKNGSASFLFFSDQFSRFSTENVNDVPTKQFTSGTWSRYTSGLYYAGQVRRLILNSSAYYQFGKNQSGENTSAYMINVLAGPQFGKTGVFAGFDFTSGNASAGTSRSFDPLYGTPHKFWGAMDYFYAGSGFGRGGLVDYYLRIKYKKSSKLAFSADVHHFKSASADNLTVSNSRRLGEEVDLLAAYTLGPDIGFEAGYSHFFSSELLSSAPLKNVPNARNNANWAYVMINIKPNFIFK